LYSTCLDVLEQSDVPDIDLDAIRGIRQRQAQGLGRPRDRVTASLQEVGP
jgi:hypothetical protein